MKQKIIVGIKNKTFSPKAELSTDYFVFSYNTLIPDKSKIHYHTCYEFEILVDGVVELEINSSKHICNAKDYWIVYPNNYHKCTALSQTAHIISIKFTEKALVSDVLFELQKNLSYSGGTLNENEYEFITREIDLLFIKLADIKTEFSKKILIRCTLSQLIGKILDRTPEQSGTDYAGHTFPKALCKSISYIKENFNQNLYRDEVAAKFGFSPSYYSAMFKRYTGKSFSSFVLGEKLDYAYYLLLATSLPIERIAEDSGFESFAYFSKSFKDAYGQTPTQLRKSTDTELADKKQ